MSASTTSSSGASVRPRAAIAAATAAVPSKVRPVWAGVSGDRLRAHDDRAVDRRSRQAGQPGLDLRLQGGLVDRQPRLHRPAAGREAHLADGALERGPVPAGRQRRIDHLVDVRLPGDIRVRDGDVAGRRPDDQPSGAVARVGRLERRGRLPAIHAGEVGAAHPHAREDPPLIARVRREQGGAGQGDDQDEAEHEPGQQPEPDPADGESGTPAAAVSATGVSVSTGSVSSMVVVMENA